MPNQSYYKKDSIKVDKTSKDWIDLKKNLKKVFINTNKNYKRNNRIKLMEPTYGVEEIIAANEVLISTNVTMGTQVAKFEKNYAKIYKFKHAVSCNSGSSANLLALSVLTDRNLNILKPGDEVIVSSYSWSTTIWPILQRGLVPVFVDINKETLNIDPSKIIEAITKKTKAIMIVHTYGNPCQMTEINKIVSEKKLILIEDCCEAMGATYKDKSVGSFGILSTFSFYFSHHITTLEGGICITRSSKIRDYIKIQRSHGWIRDIKNSEKFKKHFRDFDKNFIFVSEGYNLRLNELQAAIGVEQLKKINNFVKKRRYIANQLIKFFNKKNYYLRMQKETPHSKNSYFGIAIIVTKNKYFNRDELVKFLNSNKIETRPIICGDFSKQPGMTKFKYRVSGDMKNSSFIEKNSLAIGCHQNLDVDEINYIKEVFKKFFKAKKL